MGKLAQKSEMRDIHTFIHAIVFRWITYYAFHLLSVARIYDESHLRKYALRKGIRTMEIQLVACLHVLHQGFYLLKLHSKR